MGEPFSCDTSLLRQCVASNVGYEVLGTVHRRLLEDDLEGLEADLGNGECAKGSAMLVFACLHGARRCAQYLVKQGAMQGLEMGMAEVWGGRLTYFIPITSAAALCHWEVVEALIEGGAEAHAFDGDHRSALLIAVNKYPNANLEFLLRHEATRQHINTANGDGMTPLMAASASAVPLLVEAGADVHLDTQDGGTALGHACQLGQLEKIEALCKYGADVQHADCHGITPLMFAAQRGQADIVDYLLGRPGVDIDAKAADGKTALYLACENANFEVLTLLVAAGARVNPQASDEWGPLALAAFRGRIEVVKYLMEECGADEQHAGPDGRTPLILAAQEGHADIEEYLRRTISLREQEALRAAEERADLAAAALLEEEERVAPKATKKRKKKKQREQEQAPASTLEASGNPTDTQAVTAGLSSLGLGQEATVTGGEGWREGGEGNIGSRALSGSTTAEDAGDEPHGLTVASDEAAATTVTHGKPTTTEGQVREASPLLVMPEELSCPISLELMTDPVVADDGNTYQRAAIEAWIYKCTAAGRPLTSPLTGADMGPNLKPNLLVRSLVVRGYDRR